MKKNIVKDIGFKIKSLRKQLGLTQGDLAKKVKIHQQVISRIEAGNQNITFGTLGKICDALGYEITIFFSNPKVVTYTYGTSGTSNNIHVTWDKSG